MKKPIKIDMSATVSLEQATDILSDAIEEISGKAVKEIVFKYAEDGKFDGFHVIFDDSNSINIEHNVDNVFRPMTFC
jgi:hypothetical protein